MYHIFSFICSALISIYKCTFVPIHSKIFLKGKDFNFKEGPIQTGICTECEHSVARRTGQEMTGQAVHEVAMVIEKLSKKTKCLDTSFHTRGETEPLQAKEPERVHLCKEPYKHIPGELGSHLTGIPHC